MKLIWREYERNECFGQDSGRYVTYIHPIVAAGLIIASISIVVYILFGVS